MVPTLVLPDAAAANRLRPSRAARYGDGLRGDEAETVDLLTQLAGDDAALEFAIGSGRVALPLADRGVEVDGIELSLADRGVEVVGIELSLATISALRAKPGGDSLHVVEGDMHGAAGVRRAEV